MGSPIAPRQLSLPALCVCVQMFIINAPKLFVAAWAIIKGGAAAS